MSMQTCVERQAAYAGMTKNTSDPNPQVNLREPHQGLGPGTEYENFFNF